jgi:acetoacetate decarboxylase
MTEDEVRQRAFAMPLTSPAYPKGPYRFVDREYLIFTYRSDPALEKIVPAPLELHEPLVKFEFMKMPDSTGFGDYCESGQVIPVSFRGEVGGYQHAMYLNDHAPIGGGRDLWGFPKKLGCPELRVHKDTLVGTLDFNGIRIAIGTMGYKHGQMDSQSVFNALSAPTFLLKIIPHPWMGHRGSASSCVIPCGTSPSKAPGADPGRWHSSLTPWLQSPNCRSWKWSRLFIS